MVTGVEVDVKEVEYVHYQCSLGKWKGSPGCLYNVFNLGGLWRFPTQVHLRVAEGS